MPTMPKPRPAPHAPGEAKGPAAPAPSQGQTALLTTVALLAFAGNSLLCRAALRETDIGASAFTLLRIAAGAAMLALIVAWRDRGTARPLAALAQGSWASALALFAYAAGFSWAYLQLDTGVGALLLFGAVQVSMIGWGLLHGERLRPLQWLGLLAALAGLVLLLAPSAMGMPGVGAPAGSASEGAGAGAANAALWPGTLMMLAGLAWGVYTLRGRGAQDPSAITAGNFVRSVPMALALWGALAVSGPWLGAGDLAGVGAGSAPGSAVSAAWPLAGVLLAVASGALTSGVGYAVWYAALRQLPATRAAVLQLTVPVLAAAAGVLLLGEPVTARLLMASLAVLGGVGLVLAARGRG